MRIRVQIWIQIQIQGFDEQKLEKMEIYLSLGLHKGRPSYKRSLHPSKDPDPAPNTYYLPEARPKYL
jgi:hypothetical protein